MSGVEVLAAGAVIGAYGSYYSAKKKADGLEEQAYYREQQAYQAYLSGEREATLTTRRGERFLGRQLAAIGQSGTSVQSVSNLMAMEETVANYKEDAFLQRQAASYRYKNSLLEAGADIRAAEATRSAAKWNIASGLVGAAGKNPYTYDAPRYSGSGGGSTSGGSFMNSYSGSSSDPYESYARGL